MLWLSRVCHVSESLMMQAEFALLAGSLGIIFVWPLAARNSAISVIIPAGGKASRFVGLGRCHRQCLRAWN